MGGRIGETLFGSGTSQAAAATSAAVALLLQRHPDWTPNQVKAAVRDGSPAGGRPRAVGRGRIDVAAAAGAQPADRAQPFKQAKLWGRALNRRRTPRRPSDPQDPRPALERPPLERREVERCEVERRQVVTGRPGGG